MAASILPAQFARVGMACGNYLLATIPTHSPGSSACTVLTSAFDTRQIRIFAGLRFQRRGISEVFGCLKAKKKGRTLSIEDMNDIAAGGWAGKR